jgi:hypothetical protein
MAEGSAITVKIGAETDGIEQGLKGIQNSLKNLESNTQASAEGFSNSFTGMAGAVAVGQLAVKAFSAAVDVAFSAARNVVQGFGDALDLGGRLSDLSASTGETAGKLLVLERAFDNSGIGADKVGSTIAKMQKNIEDARDGSGTAANAFAAMGVSVDELEGKLPTEQFKILSSGIQSIDDPTKRAAAAMGVFGKSGAELLPLLTNLDGELGEARDTVGSMAEIMDRRNATFDAVGDRFKTIGEKVRDFAAGILDKALPAIDAITSALSRIDAAKIGQNLADAFLGGEKAMGGFQAAVDGFKTGQISAGLQVFWDSTKLQAAQTANEINKRFIASLQTAGDFLVKIFGPGSGAFSVVADAFGVLGLRSFKAFASAFVDLMPSLNSSLLGPLQAAATLMPNIFAPALLAFKAAAAGTEVLKSGLDGIDKKIQEQNENLGKSVDAWKTNAAEAGAALPKSFEENYAKVPPLFADLEGLQKSIEEQEKAIKKTAEETNAERANTTEQLEKEKKARAKIAAKAAEDAEKEKANAVALVQLETAINTAKASGNEELVKSLESQKQKLDNEKEIAKLTAEYLPLVGNNAKEAARLATNMVNAKNAAAAIGNRTAVVSVITKVDSAALDELLVKLRVADNPKLIEVICKVTGSTSLAEAEQKLLSIQNADAKKTVVFDALKTQSWEETFDKLNGLPPVSSRQLAMSLTKTENFDQALDQIWKLPSSKDVRLQLQAAGFESLEQFKQSLTDVATPKEAKVICQTLGVPDLQAAQQLISTIIAFNNAQTEIKVAADTKPADAAIAATTAPKETTVTAKADTASAQTSLYELNQTPVTISADADINAARSRLDSLAADPFTISADADTADAKNKVDMLGSAPLVFSLDGDTSDVQSKISTLSGEPVTLSLNADTTTAEQKIADLSTKTATVPLDGDTSPLQSSLSAFTATAQKLTLDASDAIKTIRAELEKPIKLDLSGATSSGGGGNAQGGLTGLVESIKSLLEKIEPRLPVAALV